MAKRVQLYEYALPFFLIVIGLQAILFLVWTNELERWVDAKAEITGVGGGRGHRHRKTDEEDGGTTAIAGETSVGESAVVAKGENPEGKAFTKDVVIGKKKEGEKEKIKKPEKGFAEGKNMEAKNDGDASPQRITVPPKPLTCRSLRRVPGVAINFKGGVLRKLHTFYSTRWGNVISPYWAARTLAQLGGYAYEGRVFGSQTWMKYLPTKTVSCPPRKKEFNRACECHSMEFYHECNYGWGDIYETIRSDTRKALTLYAQDHPEEQKLYDHNQFNPSDWLIYDRCCIFCHDLHGFANSQLYDSIPTEGAFTVYTLTQNDIDASEGNNLCGTIHSFRDAYIKERNPSITVSRLEPSDLWVDYARLVFAPNVLIPSAGSSWTLWTTLANNGTVVTVPLLENMDVSVYPPNFIVRDDVPVVHVKETLGIKNLKDNTTTQILSDWFFDKSTQ